jgi:pyrimidine-specific ribonucleoside hydrolase
MPPRGPSSFTRRQALLGGSATLTAASQSPKPIPRRVPVIDITDLYHPPQDPGDNFDLIAAYALPEIDLRAVILDPTQRFRAAVATAPDGSVQAGGPRDAGIIPVVQLNYLFDRNVPYGIGPFNPLKRPSDKALDAPAFQQTGVDLILETLRRSRERVHIVSFGSARTLAAAYNREPGLLQSKVELIHLCAGSTSPEFMEWNVLLDPHAIVCLLRSKLPIAIYPCGTKDGAFAYDSHNTFWKLPDLQFIRKLDPHLQRYLAYVFERSSRVDFLNALDADWPPEAIDDMCARSHSVWETAVWIQVSGRRLVRTPRAACHIIPAIQVTPADRVLPNDLLPCDVSVQDTGAFTFQLTAKSRSNFSIYDRGDWKENEAALREALPALYESFRCAKRA